MILRIVSLLYIEHGMVGDCYGPEPTHVRQLDKSFSKKSYI